MAIPQSFNDVIAILNTSVNRPDIAPSYADFINRAVRDTAAAHSFEQMKATATVTLPAGAGTIALPLNWKEPQNGRFWSFAKIGSGTQAPCPVYSRSEIERLAASFLPSPYLVFTQDNSAFQLGLLPPAVASAAWAILVYYYAYPDVVTDLTKGTPLLTFYPNAILSKTLSLIFQSISDPVWQEHEQAWQTEMQRITGVDVGAANAAPRPDKE